MRRLATTTLLLAHGLLASSVEAQSPSATPTTESAAQAAARDEPYADAVDDRTSRARRHFQNGVKLYRDANYAGALAAFEAAYALKPGPSSLQNVALSQKGLFRYAEAADTLRTLLDRHGAELDAGEKKAVADAIEELNSLVGSIVVHVTPKHASVTIDGAKVESAELEAGLRLNAGEHTLVAEAPGYARERRAIRVAGGRERVSVSIALEPTHGFVSVRVNDPNAAIAVDGKAQAYNEWHGPLTPGRHYIQVYKTGHETYEQVIDVELGRTLYIDARVGDEVEIDLATTSPGRPGKPQIRGWYGLLALSVVGLQEAPENFSVDHVSDRSGGAIGLRAGYRIWTPIGVELMLDAGSHEVSDGCFLVAGGSSEKCQGLDAIERPYRLESQRIGGNVRMMSGGKTLRFTSTLGLGIARHRFTIDATENLGRISALSADPYFIAEVGAGYNYRNFLFEAVVVALIEGASTLRADFGSGPQRVFGENSNALPMIGLGLRGGWSEWRP